MPSQLLPPPVELVEALQGLAFWTGYRRSLFRNHPLPEAAFVAELCSLLQAHLPDGDAVAAEVQYADLSLPRSSEFKQSRERADLVVTAKASLGSTLASLPRRTRYVVEVKRASAPAGEIQDDLVKLQRYLSEAPRGRRAFLVVTSEGLAPKALVEHGIARNPSRFEKGGVPHRVRRVVKAASSFDGHATAHYVCLVEVLRESK